MAVFHVIEGIYNPTHRVEADATANDIMADTGHRSLKEVVRYIAVASQRTLPKSALVRVPTENFSIQMSHSDGECAKWDNDASQGPENDEKSGGMVPRGGIEPPTLRFSVACSTN